jgi:hypothetical protein
MHPANENIFKWRKLGWTFREISERTGIPYGTVRSRCQRAGIKPEYPVITARERFLYKYKNINAEEIRRLYWDEQKSVREVANIFAIPEKSMDHVMNFHGIPKRSKKEAARIRAANTDPDSYWKPTHDQAVAAAKKGARIRETRRRRNERRRARRAARKAAANADGTN